MPDTMDEVKNFPTNPLSPFKSRLQVYFFQLCSHSSGKAYTTPCTQVLKTVIKVIVNKRQLLVPSYRYKKFENIEYMQSIIIILLTNAQD